MAHDWSGNSADDGYFIDLATNNRIRRSTQFGFSREKFDNEVPTDVFTATALNRNAIVAALNAAKANGGGIVRLPAGNGNIDKTIKSEIPSNVLIEGAGADRTKLTYTGSRGHGLHVFDQKNVVLRDFSFDGKHVANFAINFEYGENVMAERLDVQRATNGNVRCRFTNGVTIRYCTLYNSRDYHGIAIKDIFEGGSFADEQYCRNQYRSGNATHGSQFTQNQAIYSNHCYGNGGNGINDHGMYGEIAGNLLEDNKFGGKAYDGRHLTFYYNTFRNNDSRGFAINATIKYDGRMPGFLRFEKNRFINNGSYDLGFYKQGGYGSFSYEGPVVLRDNSYSPIQGKTNIVNQPGKSIVSVCPGSGDLDASWQPREFSIASPDECVAKVELVAKFSAAPVSGTAPLVVQFTDLTEPEGVATNWQWTVDDVVFNTEQNPTRSFWRSGEYQVSLTVTDADGHSDTHTQSVSLQVSPNPSLASLLRIGVRYGVAVSMA